jgi:RNase adaptor protein for sRNA GlmZ degradation
MLKIRIFSFSYKKSGIPVDATPHGGGFIFDCRYIYNPGRLNEFSSLTGKDKEVIDFLDKRDDMKAFLSYTFEIVNRSVQNYLGRNFTNLMVCFGCTGGQHRSIYAAERLKEYLSNKFNGNIKIELIHKEFPQLSS